MDEQEAWLTLAHAPSAHIGSIAPLLRHFENVRTLVRASAAELRSAGAPHTLIESLARVDSDSITAARRWLEDEHHHLVPVLDARYPPLLREVGDAPLVLYVLGDAQCLSRAQLAIVGSRNPTPAGRENAFEIAHQLGQQGIIITSGLAAGIDAAAHRGALAAGSQTIAVCGTGLAQVYPRAHRELAAAIADAGALVSEFPLPTPAIKTNFPRRNRIISGLALGTLVIEAALRSGSLITARLAAEQGREVFAVPGSIRNPLAQGCHALIRQGAKLVERTEDVLSELGPLAGTLTQRGQCAVSASVSPAQPLDKEYEILLDALGFEPASVDLLVDRTGLSAGAVASMMLMLELDGRVESCAGGVFMRARDKVAK